MRGKRLLGHSRVHQAQAQEAAQQVDRDGIDLLRVGCPRLGLANTGRMFAIFGVTIAYYLVARWVRGREGVNLDLAYAEIPPE